ncbi:FG-GAP repeat domain-containing protein [Bacillus sp. GMs2/1]|uniref:FG-GAP repeat domain-containing protein n=1 Tax=Bacillus sp. GMs2/1 TaxID=3418493 RepID=UPI003CF3EFEC
MICPSFNRAINYMVGTHPVGITSGDFNGDGNLDLAVANNSFVSILLGVGNGTFLPAMNINIGDSPLLGILAADFNGDGKLDLAVTNNAPGNNVSVLLGNGDGTFQPSTFYPAGDAPIAITTGDFNGDGKLDLAVTDVDVGANNVSVLLGNGDGTFQPPLSFPVGQSPVGIASADFNGDGKLDLVVANEFSQNISVLLGNGDGTFQAAVSFEVGQSLEVIIAADFNNDGAIDIAVQNYESNNVSVLLNNCFSSCGQQHSQQVCYVLQFNISTQKFSTTITCGSCNQSVTFNPSTGNLTITLPFTVTYTVTITNTFELDCNFINVQTNF